ncbi:DEAD/DEAH box helicase family protein, partial [Staphylococcus pseudintermedius]|uniref:DEAD/DEAH box helicase n=1 Tax=Staphylococcus pseudintermedius TaxID=283734 RepID=UPI002885807B
MSEVARRATDKSNRVLFCVHRIELVNQIKNTFRLNNVDMDLCHVGMVQTIKNRVKRGAEPEPSIILVDEAHHSLAKTYIDIFEAFPTAYVFGFSATPCRLNGRGFTDVFTDLIPGKTVKWLIDNKRLAPFKYYSV